MLRQIVNKTKNNNQLFIRRAFASSSAAEPATSGNVLAVRDAINKGIAMSSGNWITWQNCDDYYVNKDALSIFFKAIISNPSKKLFIGNINLVSQILSLTSQ